MPNAAEALGSAAAPAGAAATPPAGGTPPAGSATPPAGDGGAPPAGGSQWFDGIQNPELKTWVQAKGWKDPAAVAESTYNLEKLIGFEKAGRTVVLPKEDATPEELRAFHQKMGVPEKADDYLGVLKVPEGQSDAFAKQAANWFHEAGIPPKQAAILAEKWNAYAQEQGTQQQTVSAQQSEADFGKVVSAWGKDADANLELGKRAAQQFIPAKTSDERAAMLGKIEAAIGTEAMLNMFASIGKGMGEHRMVTGEGSMFGMSPAEAQAKIASLKSDKTWTQAYLSGDKSKLSELERLTKIAYPEQGGA